MKNYFFLIVVALILIGGCCKEKDMNKNVCTPVNIGISPFQEKFDKFTCGNNDYEYTFIFNKSTQIDSLYPTCSYRQILFPTDETGMRYIMVGRMSYHYNDTFQTVLSKDTCLKTVTYEVNMVQHDTALWSNGGGVLSMYCAVENIPADYKVEVKYKYVPLP